MGFLCCVICCLLIEYSSVLCLWYLLWKMRNVVFLSCCGLPILGILSALLLEKMVEVSAQRFGIFNNAA